MEGFLFKRRIPKSFDRELIVQTEMNASHLSLTSGRKKNGKQ